LRYRDDSLVKDTPPAQPVPFLRFAMAYLIARPIHTDCRRTYLIAYCTVVYYSACVCQLFLIDYRSDWTTQAPPPSIDYLLSCMPRRRPIIGLSDAVVAALTYSR